MNETNALLNNGTKENIAEDSCCCPAVPALISKWTKPKKTILVTGYGPFNQYKVNPSWEAVKTLPKTIQDYHIVKVKLTVCYRYVEDHLADLIKQHNPSLVVHCGVAPSDSFRFEEVAHNFDYNNTDIDNEKPLNGLCIKDLPTDVPNTICTKVDTKGLKEKMIQLGWNASISRDAGRYLCEFALCTSLYTIRGTPIDGKALFIHIPPVDCPYSQEDLCKGINDAMELLVADLN
ncbi:hypothetical protein BC833DRAFT_626148 [Globomyces pollinis-pini]|nr:hypothetical protein BC833DRAFT_626148 [Globomyces pollinis-pini]